MAKKAYIGVDSVAKNIKGLYIGVDGLAKSVSKAYIGVDGLAKLWFENTKGWELVDTYEAGKGVDINRTINVSNFSGSVTVLKNSRYQTKMSGIGVSVIDKSGTILCGSNYTSNSIDVYSVTPTSIHIETGSLSKYTQTIYTFVYRGSLTRHDESVTIYKDGAAGVNTPGYIFGYASNSTPFYNLSGTVDKSGNSGRFPALCACPISEIWSPSGISDCYGMNTYLQGISNEAILYSEHSTSTGRNRDYMYLINYSETSANTYYYSYWT